MVLFFRVVLIILKNLFRRRGGMLDESVLRLRVWPTDMDLNFHLNDGRYVSLTGLGRLDLMAHSGLMRKAIKRRWYPVVGGAVIRYRREIGAFEKFTLHSRIAGWDEKWFYFEHRFEKDATVAALAYSRGVMRTREGAIPTREVLALIGSNETSPPITDIVSKFS